MLIWETQRLQTLNILELLLLFAHRDLQRIVRIFSGNLVYQQMVILYLLTFNVEHNVLQSTLCSHHKLPWRCTAVRSKLALQRRVSPRVNLLCSTDLR